MTITGLLFVLLVVIIVVMMIRDGRPFFADFLKVTLLVIALLLVLIAVVPGISVHVGR